MKVIQRPASDGERTQLLKMLKEVEPLRWRGWLIGSAFSFLLFGIVPWLLTDDKGARIFLLALGLGTVVVFFIQDLYLGWRDRRDIQTLRNDVSSAIVEETQIELTRMAEVHSQFDVHYVMEVEADELAFLSESSVCDVDFHPRESIKVVRAIQNGRILAIHSHGKSIAPGAIYEVVKDDRPGGKGLPLHDQRPFRGRLEQLPAIFKERGITMRLVKEQPHS